MYCISTAAIVTDISSMFAIFLNIRYGHSSWASPSGTILMGGEGSQKTTEKIQQNGTSSYSFELKYETL